MDIEAFMLDYKAAWEQRDERLLCNLFAPDGTYHNTPFAEQRGHAEIAAYWQRVKLQEDIHVSYQVLARTPGGGVAHWHVTYQVASEELFAIWAKSTGTGIPARTPGDPLPRLALDGILVAEFNAAGLCQACRIWWHSIVQGNTR
jgi:limonene-1,2-epoxide hydrolase